MKYTFREFLKLDKETRTRLGTIGIYEDLSGSQKEKKMKELEKKLKTHDYYFSYGDHKSWKKGQKEQDEIRKLVDEIGEDGLSLYKQYLKKKGLIENKKTPRMTPYEKFVQQKMDTWKIKSLDELEPEPLKRFMKELDDEWVSKDEKEDEKKEHKSMFPEMNQVQRSGSLEYSPRQIGERSITGHSFGDGGNLYPEHITPKWVPPSKERRKHYE